MTLLTLEEAAIRLRLSPDQVKDFAKYDKDFPCVPFGRNSKRAIAENLDGWLAGLMADRVVEVRKPKKVKLITDNRGSSAVGFGAQVEVRV